MKTFYRSVCAVGVAVGIGALFLTDANATEIKVLAAAALPGVLNELVPAYEKASGNKGSLFTVSRRIFGGGFLKVNPATSFCFLGLL
jgi:ABC-type molybdate transport system substrate-binding protein